jgi:hypothetical protein
VRRSLEQRPHRVQSIGVSLDARGKRVFRLVGLQLELVGGVLPDAGQEELAEARRERDPQRQDEQRKPGAAEERRLERRVRVERGARKIQPLFPLGSF